MTEPDQRLRFELPRAGDAALVGGTCLFACWTLFCNAMVLIGANFSDLISWSLLPIVTGLALAALCLPGQRPAESSACEPPTVEQPTTIGWGVRMLTPVALSGLAVGLRLLDAPHLVDLGCPGDGRGAGHEHGGFP